MSHLKERKDRNCLNCNAQVHGKYCSICGQENIQPEETVWHLITHFFNDITHFDGKFFSTLNLLIFKPGFLSAEYKAGRRASYLNPVRMYIFTSFIFFLVFFSVYTLQESAFMDKNDKSTVLRSVLRLDTVTLNRIKMDVDGMDSAAYSLFIRALNNGSLVPKTQFYQKLDSSKKNPYAVPLSPLIKIGSMDSSQRNSMNGLLAQMDDSTFSKFTRIINEGESLSRREFAEAIDDTKQIKSGFAFTREYESRTQYDSLLKTGNVKDGWLKQRVTRKFFDIKEKYSNNTGKLFTTLFNILFHNFPQMLFVSLPLFAMFLKLIYYRHKDFYFVSHGIYSVHLYIFYFIALLFLIGVHQLAEYVHGSFFPMTVTVVAIILLLYEYKAMRNFYGQGRGKTILKFLLATSWRFVLITILFIFFLFFSLLKV